MMIELWRKLTEPFRSKLPLGFIPSFLVALLLSLIFQFAEWPKNEYLRGSVCGFTFFILIGFDVWIRDTSSSHTFRSALDQYFALNFLDILGWNYYRKMMKDVQKIREVQEEVLLKFISANAHTDYGRKFGFDKIESRSDFVDRHPLITYPDIEPYIERMKSGETNVFTEDQPKIFAVTSGTSGKSSILPFLKKQQTLFFLRGITIMSHLMNWYFPETTKLRKGIKFSYSPRWRTSASGVPIGPNSSSPTSSKSILHLYTTPAAGFKILNEKDALYVHLLFALKDREAGLIEANFASLVYYAFEFLEERWSDLVRDIRDGTLLGSLDIAGDARTELERLLQPDANRAVELTNAFQIGFVGIAKRIWPKMSLILCVDSGAFEIYASVLRRKYCLDIPLYSPLYAATEGLIGLNIWPLVYPSKYLLVPRVMFFEFIPVDSMDEEQPKTLFMDQVTPDETYELVLTNASGLCRYRFGDVVRVVEYFEQCPVIQFLYRKGQLLNVRGEKLSEKDVFDALRHSIKSMPTGNEIIDYVTCESVSLERKASEKQSAYRAPFYGIFLELKTESTLQFVQTLTSKIDSRLQDVFYVYKSFRKNESIGMPKIYLVQPGTFARLRQLILENSEASANQLKIPRVVRKPELVAFLLEQCQK